MFKKVGIFMAIAALMVGVVALADSSSSFFGDPTSAVNALPKQELSEQEIQTLSHMLEEEKLARDVYYTLYQEWHFQAFYNISKSEQTHMLAVKAVLEKYGLDTSVYDMKVGEFKTREMTQLYNELVEQGRKSLTEALKVGATIEDLDIYDLEKALKVVDNEDIRLVYKNLVEGSKNHIRAFIRTMERYNVTYKAQYISQKELEEILKVNNSKGYGSQDSGNPPMESKNNPGIGSGNGHGKGYGKGKGEK